MRSLRPTSPLWHDRGFVKLWAANGISQLGTQAQPEVISCRGALLITSRSIRINSGIIAVKLTHVPTVKF